MRDDLCDLRVHTHCASDDDTTFDVCGVKGGTTFEICVFTPTVHRMMTLFDVCGVKGGMTFVICVFTLCIG